jgi:hypothetical protein
VVSGSGFPYVQAIRDWVNQRLDLKLTRAGDADHLVSHTRLEVRRFVLELIESLLHFGVGSELTGLHELVIRLGLIPLAFSLIAVLFSMAEVT